MIKLTIQKNLQSIKEIVNGAEQIIDSVISTFEKDKSYIDTRLAICNSCENIVKSTVDSKYDSCGLCGCTLHQNVSYGLVNGKHNKCKAGKW